MITTQANTPLLAAKASANIAMAGFLLNNGADPNFSDSGINTPLIEAIETAVEDNDYLENFNAELNLDILRLLLKYNANINLKVHLATTLISFAKISIYQPLSFYRDLKC